MHAQAPCTIDIQVVEDVGHVLHADGVQDAWWQDRYRHVLHLVVGDQTALIGVELVEDLDQ